MPRNRSETTELLDESSFEAQYGQPRRTLQKWRVEGRGPRFLKVGRRVFYRRSDIEAWLESCLRSSTSDDGEAA